MFGSLFLIFGDICEFIEEMYGNVENPRIIVQDCDKYSHLTLKFYLKCCVLSFLRLKTAILAIRRVRR